MTIAPEVETSYQLVEVSLEKISLNPFQPRRNFSEEELVELAESIRSVGLIHPPLVRPKPDGDGYELVSGERRFRASRMAGLTTIPVLVREASNMASAQAALIENVQRVDLNPVEVAKGLRRLMESFGFNQDELAERVGKKRPTIANYLRLLTLPKSIQDSLTKGDISMGHAKAILSLEGFERQMMLHDMIMNEGLSVRAAEEHASKIAHQKPTKNATPPPSERNVFIEEVENRLRQSLGTKVTIQSVGSKGKLIIDYYSLDDLDRLIAIIETKGEQTC